MILDQIPDRALARIAGGLPRPGNAVRLLRDADENYPAWLEAIRGAERFIRFENFIVASDEAGQAFAEALCERARAGVAVRVLYDWLGSSARASGRFWKRLRAAGVEVRSFAPLSLASPLWIRRDHRKLVVVDGTVGFVSGLCIGEQWTGTRCAEPWRDTGVAVRGPAVADLDRSFAEMWALAGPPLPAGEEVAPEALPAAGDQAVRVLAGRPGEATAFRLDLLAAATARKRLWITDAYFVPTSAYVQALSEAARDGVDVRLLVPGTSDVPFLQPLVQSGYRPLVEAGVRVFEWNGSMLHAKTAVADGSWARVGSTNCNLTSWLTNWELDLLVTDERFGAEMEAMYLADLTRSTEIVTWPRRVKALTVRDAVPRRPKVRQVAAGALGLSQAARAAIAGARTLTETEARSVARVGLLLLAVATLITIFPVLLVSPVVIMMVWIAAALLRRAWRARRVHSRQKERFARRRAALAEMPPPAE